MRDIYLEGLDLPLNVRMSDEAEGIRQHVTLHLQNFLGQWFLDREHGFPWLEVLGQKGNEELIERLVRKWVLDVPGVKSISDMQLKLLRSRHLAISLVISSKEGSFNVDFDI